MKVFLYTSALFFFLVVGYHVGYLMGDLSATSRFQSHYDRAYASLFSQMASEIEAGRPDNVKYVLRALTNGPLFYDGEPVKKHLSQIGEAGDLLRGGEVTEARLKEVFRAP